MLFYYPKKVISLVTRVTLSINSSHLYFHFSDEEINGSAFFELTDDDLQCMKIKIGPRKIILKLIGEKKDTNNVSKYCYI